MKEQEKKLKDLVQLDIDAVHAYEQAIENIEEESIRKQLIKYREDHQEHIASLSAALHQMGEAAPEYSPDFKGFLLSGFTSLRSATGTAGALKAMQFNEKLTNRKYDDAATWGIDSSVKAIIDRNLQDERRHLDYIDEAIENRIWEKVKA